MAGPTQVKTRHDVERDPDDGHGHVHVHDVHAYRRGRAREFAKLSPELDSENKPSDIKRFDTTHGSEPGSFLLCMKPKLHTT